ncbi:tRNA (adenine(58)-N(1))-methyltransferase non-catalytic subunit trm6 [Malassezia psittaci]|uniref:tRNA (adenine(58)-N(1))-methyltransferase non-catalytic subunit TRM6 n=1 Tax=Malassezia psittaci TaxID=1821823 RepID=A0AAF0JEI9_9BASI|nr:tRNA (adenine(58)-N(1))-methyltransferase non-catalytic subunit trm6 [Malassezia psittaci]
MELVPLFNLTPEHMQGVLHTMHWAATEKRWNLPSHMADELARVYKTDRERNRARKKRAGFEEFVATRQRFFDGEFDARYQVLPSRTHPDMTTSASGGYILHAIRILVDPEEEAQ